jgi:hypothetical protein
MKDYVKLIGVAKARVDNGFSRVGKTLDPADPADRALMLLASRCVALANAALLLGMNNHPNEGLPLLRSLLELASHMRWISSQDSAERARRFLEEHIRLDWENLWPSARLRERSGVLGLPARVQERILRACGEHIHANALGLPWGHVFAQNADKGVSAEEYLEMVSVLMGHVVKSLDLRWPGNFPADEWENERMRS